MAQNINDLPEPIKKLALKRTEEYKAGTSLSGSLANSFIWYMTPEGAEFWSQIFEEKYQVFYDKYPNAKLPDTFYVGLCNALDELSKMKNPHIADFEKATAADAKEEFKNGEKVFVQVDGLMWVEGTFIGMYYDNMFVVAVPGEGIHGYIDCRKTPPEKEKEPADKNVFSEKEYQLANKAVSVFSKAVFGSSDTFQLLQHCTPRSRPDLLNKAFFIPATFKVTTGEADRSGTWIAIHHL